MHSNQLQNQRHCLGKDGHTQQMNPSMGDLLSFHQAHASRHRLLSHPEHMPKQLMDQSFQLPGQILERTLSRLRHPEQSSVYGDFLIYVVDFRASLAYSF